MQSKILHYMRQMAVITPYAQFLFKFVSETSEYVISFCSCVLHLSCHIVTDLIQQRTPFRQRQPHSTL